MTNARYQSPPRANQLRLLIVRHGASLIFISYTVAVVGFVNSPRLTVMRNGGTAMLDRKLGGAQEFRWKFWVSRRHWISKRGSRFISRTQDLSQPTPGRNTQVWLWEPPDPSCGDQRSMSTYFLLNTSWSQVHTIGLSKMSGPPLNRRPASNTGSSLLTDQENEVLFNHLGRKCTVSSQAFAWFLCQVVFSHAVGCYRLMGTNVTLGESINRIQTRTVSSWQIIKV